MIDVLTNILESVAMEVNWLLANSTEMAAGDAAAVEFFPRSDAAALPTLSVAVTPREISNSLEARGVIRSEVVVDLSFAKKIDSSDGIKTLSKVVETVFAGLAYGKLKGFPDASCIAAERGLFNYDAALAQRVFAATVTLTYSFFYKRKD